MAEMTKQKKAQTAKNPALDRTARLLDLVPYLATHQGVSIEEIAREFSISTSEVTEDLTTLWMCGLPGYTALELMDLSFESGNVTISNAETLARPRALDRNEALALILGLETMLEGERSDGNSLTDQIRSLLEKLSKFLDITRLIQSSDSSSWSIRGEIDAAINCRAPIQIEYHSLTRDEVNHRVIHPLEYTTHSGHNRHEYIYAFCEHSQGYRTFRLDRILSTKKVEATQAAQIQAANNSQSEVNRIVVEISSRERDVVERFNLSPENLRSESSNQVIVQSFTPDWAVREIMSFAGEVTLISPSDLRESLRQRARRALGGYIQ